MAEYSEVLASEASQERAAVAGAQPALIEQFGIRGLYGYRTISLSSKYAATILIAKNGTGKTTLLGAMDSFLKLQLYRLRNLDFSEIFCRLKGLPNDLVLTREDLDTFTQMPTDTEFARLASRSGLEPQKLFQFLLSDYKAAFENWDYEGGSPIVHLLQAFSHNQRAAERACDEAYATLFKRNERLEALRSGINHALRDHEVVYLPTYRRVELALTDEGEDARRRGRKKPKVSFTSSGLHTPEIQFGLGDISERLAQLNNEIITRSNVGYREISENIINELIRGYEVDKDRSLPKPDDLRLFFSRLESGIRRMGPHYTKISAPDFERIYTGEGVPPESLKFLTYFLGKLSAIIDITKDIEQPVGDFVASCNRYLSSTEPSTSPPSTEHKRLIPADSKALKVNRTDLSVNVESIPARTPISLDALSSGEKQMISLFAKMYLYPKKKIVLIDEPELSLSIDWQRGILIDVLLSPQCEQVVAITHSPFVFDNSLEQFARTLDIEVAKPLNSELQFGNDDEFGDSPVD